MRWYAEVSAGGNVYCPYCGQWTGKNVLVDEAPYHCQWCGAEVEVYTYSHSPQPSGGSSGEEGQNQTPRGREG